MSTHPDFTSEQIRRHLLERATAFVENHKGPRKITFSYVSIRAVNDSKFLDKVAKGENFTLKTFQMVIDWLDEQERSARECAA